MNNVSFTYRELKREFQCPDNVAYRVQSILLRINWDTKELLTCPDLADMYPKSVGRLYHNNDYIYAALLAANDELFKYGTFGVEGICPDPPDSHANIYYLNTGDTYSITIVYDIDLDMFSLGCWGDYEEQAQQKWQEEFDLETEDY